MVETRAEAAIESKLDTVADDISDESESDQDEYSLASSFDSQVASKHDDEEDR